MICSLKINITFPFNKSIHTQTTFPLFPPRIEPNTNDAWCPPFVHVACTSSLPSLFFCTEGWQFSAVRRQNSLSLVMYQGRKFIFFLHSTFHITTHSHTAQEKAGKIVRESFHQSERVARAPSPRESFRVAQKESGVKNR